MKTKTLAGILMLLTLLSGITQADPVGTAFTYQGKLADGGQAANGRYDLQFTLYDAVTAGSVQGGPLTTNAVAVSDGLFVVALDFGAGVFNGDARWLEIGVRTNGSVAAHTLLTPRQSLTAAPYALYALTAASAAAATNVPWSGLTGLPPGFADGVDNDTLYAAGTGLTLAGTNLALNTAFTDGRYWKLIGNAGTTPGVNFLGTTDDQALELKVNNQRAWRLEPNATSPNVIGGYSGNVVDSGVYGATIGGGGYLNSVNHVKATYSTIGGGIGNTIETGASYSTIGAGSGNTIETGVDISTIGGGGENTIEAQADRSTIGGGRYNEIQANAESSTISGGYANTIETNTSSSTIGGGAENKIEAFGESSTIGGGSANTISTNAYYGTIAGGGWLSPFNNATGNRVTDRYGTVGGGGNNQAGDGAGTAVDSAYATVAGGRSNTAGGSDSAVGGGRGNTASGPAATIGGGTNNIVHTNTAGSTIAGGLNNTIAADASAATIAGGYYNNIGTNSDRSAIGGGYDNNIAANSAYATIAGGYSNDLGTNSDYSAIGGGYHNKIAANSTYATIAGGYYGDIGTNSDYSAIGGGYYNTVQTNTLYATIPGGKQAKAAAYGQFAYASGQFAAKGDAQASMFVLRRTASGATPAPLFLDGSGAQITVPTNSTWAFDILVVGRSTDSFEFGATSAAYQIRGLVENDSVGTRVFALTPTILHEDDSAWSVSVETDGAASHLVIKVVSTGYTVRWVANVRTAEVAFP